MMLYVSCEVNFKQGIKVLEAIIAENTRLNLQEQEQEQKQIQENKPEKKEQEKEEKEEKEKPGEAMRGDVANRVFVNY